MNRKIRTDEAAVSANLRLDTRRVRANNTYPTKLEVYFKGAKKRYDLKTYFSTEDWEKANSPKLKDETLKRLKNHIQLQQAKANKIIEELKDNFTFPNFEKFFLDKPISNTEKDDVFKLFEEHLKNLKSNDRIGYAESFKSTIYNLREYKPKLRFKDITPVFLNDFENWLVTKEKKVSYTSVGFYMRNLRVIYNLAIERGLAKREDYPFGQKSKKKYEIPTGRNIKKALGESDIQKIANYQAITEEQERARDIWLFSFLCNGMNLVDICHLKFENIAGEFFHFFRIKIDGRQREKTPVEVYLSDSVKNIINKWGNKFISKDDYVFPFLKKGMNAEEQHRAVKNLTRSINQYMKKISKKLELNSKCTTYVARHSYGTILRDKGVSLDLIKENYGHKSIKTTAIYIDKHDPNEKKKTASIINQIVKL